MDETSQLGLPLLQPSQAQKHVTVNEGLAMLDGLVQMTLMSVSLTVPPTNALDGECYAVPAGAVNDWNGNEGELAIFSNGGWVYVTPKFGWRGWIADQGKAATFDGSDWIVDVIALAASGTASLFEVLEFDHVLSAGPYNDTLVKIPTDAMVFVVTGVVRTVITGALTSWEIGLNGDEDRYGGNLGLSVGTGFNGSFGRPLTYINAKPLRLSGIGGDFAAGEIRIAIHYYIATIPTV